MKRLRWLPPPAPQGVISNALRSYTIPTLCGELYYITLFILFHYLLFILLFFSSFCLFYFFEFFFLVVPCCRSERTQITHIFSSRARASTSKFARHPANAYTKPSGGKHDCDDSTRAGRCRESASAAARMAGAEGREPCQRP